MTPTDSASEQFLAEALVSVRQGLFFLKHTFTIAHPQPGCLPQPELRIPQTAADLAVYATHIHAALWDRDQVMSPPWSERRFICEHGLDVAGVLAAFEVISHWRALVAWAADHANRVPQALPLSGGDYLQGLARHCADLVSRAPGIGG